MSRRLTDHEIDVCRTIGRNEEARSTTIGLNEMDALCAEAIERGRERDELRAAWHVINDIHSLVCEKTMATRRPCICGLDDRKTWALELLDSRPCGELKRATAEWEKLEEVAKAASVLAFGVEGEAFRPIREALAALDKLRRKP